MYKFHNNMLPYAFKSFFNKFDQVLKYNTRLVAKQSYYIPKVRTNYGIFNLTLFGLGFFGVPGPGGGGRGLQSPPPPLNKSESIDAIDMKLES